MEMLARVRDSAYECQESQEIECEGLKKLKLFRGLDKEHRFTADKTYSLE